MVNQQQHDAGRYRVRVVGHVARHWLVPVSGVTVTWEPAGTTAIEGALPDQAALHGLLARVRDLGLTLLAVERVAGEDTS